jgi:geranylgeranyl pyrophosphate synthase
MALRIGSVVGVPRKTLVHAAAAVEMIHAASLLHDDVIDGGFLRRSEPAFWVERGIPGAILVGDLLLFKALDLCCRVEKGRLTHSLVRLSGDVCLAESEQELVYRGKNSNWEICVSIARRKTGALFAFIGQAAGGTDPELSQSLKEAGFQVGTAYQLADDILDANGDLEAAGKTLGTDKARNKTTASSIHEDGEVDPVLYVRRLTDSARNGLSAWPEVRKAWDVYMKEDMAPVLDRHLKSLTS